MADKLVDNLKQIGNLVTKGGMGLMTMNVARERGNDLATNNQIVTDRDTLDPIQFQKQYSPEVVQTMNRLDQSAVEFERFKNGDRTGGQAIADAITNFGSAFNGGIGNAAAVIARPVSRDLATGIVGVTKDFTDYNKSAQSDYMVNNRQLDAIRTELDNADNAAQYERERKTDGDFLAGLKSLGRDAMGGITRLTENPAGIEEGVTNAVGSLAAAALITRGIGGPAAVAAPVATGVMEGGGAYADVVSEIMGKSHEELMVGSEAYRQKIAAGMAPDEAKQLVADEGGIIAASTQGPIAAVTGGLIDRASGGKFSEFVANPISRSSLGSLAGNMARETIEETAQSFTGEVSQNLGKQRGDEAQALLEGAGASAVQGGIFGGLSAGLTGAPGAAVQTTAQAAKAALGAIVARGEAIQQSNVEASGVTDLALGEQGRATAENLDTMVQSAQALAATPAPAPVETAEPVKSGENPAPTQTYTPEEVAQKVSSVVTMTRDDLVEMGSGMIRILRDRDVQDPTDRFEVVKAAALTAADPNQPQADRITAGLFLTNQIEKQDRFLEEDLPIITQNADQNSDEYKLLENYGSFLQAVKSLPAVQEAMSWAQGTMDSVDPIAPTRVTPETLATPEGQQALENTVQMAKTRPELVDTVEVEGVLRQADEGNIQLPEADIQALKMSMAVTDAGRLYTEIMNNQESKIDPDYVAPSPMEMVGKAIEENGGAKSYQFSIPQHAKRIASAPNEQVRRRRVTDLNMFARHMRNKVDALNRSLRSGVAETYQTLGADHRWVKSEDNYDITVHAHAAGSLALGRKIYAEAQAVAAMANAMNSQNPGYGLSEIVIPDLDPAFSRPPVQRQDTRTAAQRFEEETQTDARETESLKPASVEAPVKETADRQEGPVADASMKSDAETQEGSVRETIAPTANTENGVAQQPDGVRTAEPEVPVQAPGRVETTEPPATSEVKAPSLKERFPRLLAAKGKTNMLVKSFRISKRNISKIMDQDNPIQETKEQIRREGAGTGLKYQVNSVQRDAWDGMLQVAEAVKQDVIARTKKVLTPALVEKFKAGDEITRFMNLRGLNILQTTDRGTVEYNTQLLEGAAMAAVHWMLNAHTKGYAESREDLATLFGVKAELITSDLLEAFSSTLSLDQAKQALGAQILSFWGLEAQRNADSAYTRGIVEGLAADMLRGLESEGLVSIEKVSVPFSDKTPNRVRFDNRSDKAKAVIENIGGSSTLLADLSLSQPEKQGWFIGTPPTEIAQKQLRSEVETTSQQRQVIEVAQNTPYYLNSTVADFIGALGERAFMVLMGGQDVDLNTLNVNHRKSVDGKNRGLVASYQNVMRSVAQLRMQVPAGTNEQDHPSYYAFGVSRVGRLQMEGLSNPQGDKLAREIFMPTKTTLDMRDPFGSDARAFWMTIGQGLGLKTEKLSRDAVVDQAQALISDGPNRAVIDGMKAWLQSGKGELPADLQTKVTDLAGISMHGMHSLLAVAQYENALENQGNLEAFTHFNYLEADGKTNGPINSLMLLATGSFTGDFLRLVAKGGSFLGHLGAKTLNEHVSSVDGKDLYETVSDGTIENVRHMVQNLEGRAVEQYAAFQRILAALNKDISISPEGELVMKRGVAKNPLTISIYGSGKDGIAGKVTVELIDALYERLSRGDLSGVNSADLEALITNRPKRDRETGSIVTEASRSKAGNRKSTIDFTLDPSEVESLKANVRVFLVDPLADAIEGKVMGAVSETTQRLQMATQLQSIVLAGLFRNEIIAALGARKLDEQKAKDDPSYKRLYPEWRTGDFLPDNELSAIREKLKPYSPIISTGTQNFMMSGSEQSNLFETVTIPSMNGGPSFKVSMPAEFSRAMAGDLSSPAYVFGPNLAGVRAIPSLVIGTGDGQMIQNILLAGVKGLPVFDGFNLSARDIDTGSKTINEQVWKTWTSNPMRAVQESFATFVRSNAIDAVLDENPLNVQRETMLKQISQTINGAASKDTPATAAEVQAQFKMLASELGIIADNIDARQAVLKQIPVSIDQMASAESPFTQEGKAQITQSGDLDLVAQELNALMEAPAQTTEPVQQATTELQGAVEKFAPVDADTGARVADLFSLGSIVASSQLPKQLRVLADQALRMIGKSGYKVVFGTPEQLNSYEEINQPERYTGNAETGYGKIDPVTETIFISNMSPETLTHELIHAATLAKTLAFYANPIKLSETDRQALDRIEILMREWMAQNYSAESDSVLDARRQAMSTIAGHLNAKRRGEALNEFMAWGLSNQNLMDAMSKAKVQHPYARMVREVVTAIKRLIWGDGRRGPQVGEDMLSQLRFNARVVMSTNTPSDVLSQDMASVALYQSSTFGSNSRLSELRDRFGKSIALYMQADPLAGAGSASPRSQEITEAQVRNGRVALAFASAFPMDMQQLSTFEMISSALSADVGLNSNALSRVQDIFDHVIENIKASDFIDKAAPNQEAEAFLANEKFNLLTGSAANVKDALGRSSMLPSFLALAMVDDGFREILSRMKKPKSLPDDAGTIDAALDNFGQARMDQLGVLMSGEGRKNSDLKSVMDALASSLTENVAAQKTFIEQRLTDTTDGIDAFLRDHLAKLGEKIGDIGRNLDDNGNSKITQVGGKFLQTVSSLISEKETNLLAQGLMSALNSSEANTTVRELAAEIVGRTDENASVFDMISQVRSVVEQARQQFREKLPRRLKDRFKTPLSKQEWSNLFTGLGKTDLAALHGIHGLEGALSLVQDRQARLTEIARLEGLLASEGNTRARVLVAKSKQLARYMVTGVQGERLLRNAFAVAHLFGDQSLSKATGQADGIVSTLDQLISLYAVDNLSADTLESISNIRARDGEALSYTFASLVGTRNDELRKNSTNLAKINHYKGFIKAENQEGVNLTVASRSEHARLIAMGYTEVGAYEGSSVDFTKGDRRYYFAPVSGRAKFNQGVMQTVHQTVSGIDPKTGFTMGTLLAGRIVDPAIVKTISRALARQRQTDENLLPVFSPSGQVIAYERAVNPVQLSRLAQNQNLAEMLGNWQGRQVEERLAVEMNRQLVENLHQIYEQGRKDKRTDEFVRLDQVSDDPVLQEAWGLVPLDAREHIKQLFGNRGFMVRRDMLNDVVGFRQASVGDSWTGNTRWKPAVQSEIQKLAMGFLGKDAYIKMTNTEKIIQDLVLDAKVMIVVKSVIVPLSNFVSNAFQLTTNGVPIRDILRGVPQKTAELNDYINRRGKEINLQADLNAARGQNDLVSLRKIENQIQALKDSYKRMTIWPLIQAGEFSSISEGALSVEDLAIANGRWSNMVDQLADKLPSGLQTPYRQAMITKDTSVFKAMARATQYGDFLAKAILYDDLRKRKKLSSKDALAEVAEEFVNYNRLSGRSMNYADSAGLLWFWKFKLRSMKVAARTLKRHPLRALMFMGMTPEVPFMGAIGSPLTDNMASVMMDGRLDNSMGPGMAFRAPTLNPWYALFD